MPELNVYQPWSAPLIHTILPDEVIQELIQLTDVITEDKERVSRNKTLAGEIEDEWTIDSILLTNISFKKYIDQLCWQYLKILELQNNCGYEQQVDKNFVQFRNAIENIQIVTSWFNNQKDNEYNPLHLHEGILSGVLYLKIPEYLPPRKRKETDGSIVFVGNECFYSGMMTNPTIIFSPKVGDIFLFPSCLNHMVYPFRTRDGKGIRRSLSFNLAQNSTERLDG